MTEAETAWLAGLLEGEGCFTPRKSFYKTIDGSVVSYEYPLVSLRMTDRDIIECAAKFLGNNAIIVKHPPPPDKTVFSVEFGGSRAAELMRMILPWMGERRSAKIQEVLEKYENNILSKKSTRNDIISMVKNAGINGVTALDVMDKLDLSATYTYSLCRELVAAGELHHYIGVSASNRPIRRFRAV